MCWSHVSRAEIKTNVSYTTSLKCCVQMFEHLSFAKIIHSPEVWHIKKLIKQHDHYKSEPCAGDNKRPL